MPDHPHFMQRSWLEAMWCLRAFALFSSRSTLLSASALAPHNLSDLRLQPALLHKCPFSFAAGFWLAFPPGVPSALSFLFVTTFTKRHHVLLLLCWMGFVMCPCKIHSLFMELVQSEMSIQWSALGQKSKEDIDVKFSLKKTKDPLTKHVRFQQAGTFRKLGPVTCV